MRIALLLLAAAGCAIVGGVYFAFSSFVMRALGRPAAADAVAAERPQPCILRVRPADR